MVNTNLRRSRTSSAPPTATQHHSHTDDRYNGQGTTQPSSEPLGLVAALKTHSLLLAGDVELNPGPLSEGEHIHDLWGHTQYVSIFEHNGEEKILSIMQAFGAIVLE